MPSRNTTPLSVKRHRKKRMMGENEQRAVAGDPKHHINGTLRDVDLRDLLTCRIVDKDLSVCHMTPDQRLLTQSSHDFTQKCRFLAEAITNVRCQQR